LRKLRRVGLRIMLPLSMSLIPIVPRVHRDFLTKWPS
jgi:hypothetical protein